MRRGITRIVGACQNRMKMAITKKNNQIICDSSNDPGSGKRNEEVRIKG